MEPIAFLKDFLLGRALLDHDELYRRLGDLCDRTQKSMSAKMLRQSDGENVLWLTITVQKHAILALCARRRRCGEAA